MKVKITSLEDFRHQCAKQSAISGSQVGRRLKLARSQTEAHLAEMDARFMLDAKRSCITTKEGRNEKEKHSVLLVLRTQNTRSLAR